jgi:hypothetical protein
MGIYRPELWRDLYVMLGTSSAALLGLLFVVTSLHLDEIVSNPVYRTRARVNSIFLLVTLVEAALVLTPQPMELLGLELIIVNLFGWSFPLRNTYRYHIRNRALGQVGGLSVYRAVTFHACFAAAVAGGAALMQGASFGLYLVAASYIALLVAVAMNAWSIMLGIGQDENLAKERSEKQGR